MPKKRYAPAVPPIMSPKSILTKSPEVTRAEEVLEITTLFAEALDELNMQYATALEENAELESTARKSLGLPKPDRISEVLA